MTSAPATPRVEPNPAPAAKPDDEKLKAEGKAKAKPETHDDPYPSQADIDAARLNMAKAGEYLTRVEKPKD